jgi:hypothetical protein
VVDKDMVLSVVVLGKKAQALNEVCGDDWACRLSCLPPIRQIIVCHFEQDGFYREGIVDPLGVTTILLEVTTRGCRPCMFRVAPFEPCKDSIVVFVRWVRARNGEC